MSKFKEFFSYFSHFMSKFTSSFDTVIKQTQLDSSIAPVWLAPQSEPSFSTTTLVATAMVVTDTSIVLYSLPVPECCLKEVLSCELLPLGFH